MTGNQHQKMIQTTRGNEALTVRYQIGIVSGFRLERCPASKSETPSGFVGIRNLAAFPQFITLGDTSAAASFLLVFLHSVINAIWFGAMVMLFSRLTKVARSTSFQRWLKGITGAVFIGFGVKLATIRSSV